jgi:hypothetical protein
MARKYRSTETGPTVTIPDGQHMQANYFCLNCHHIASMPGHYPDCKAHEVYAIPASAEAPRRNATARAWRIFKEQVVFAKPVGFWQHYGKSWWAKNNNQ